MKKIIAVTLILCLSMCFLTACDSISTYQDRIAKANKEDGTYVVLDFAEELEEYAEKYDLDPDDYSIIESIKCENKFVKTDVKTVVVIASWSKAKAAKLAEDLAPVVADLNAKNDKTTYEAVSDGRFVVVGDVRAVNIALGR